ncbi:MAG: hypothetical protein V4813_07330 [Gemmatimonadota bacterium]
MRKAVRIVSIALLVGMVTVVTALLLSVQRTPLVATPGEVSVGDVRRARNLLRRHDPRGAVDGEPRMVYLTQQDLTLLTQYGASRWRRAATRVTLREGAADVQASVDLGHTLLGRWLNVRASVGSADGLPRVTRLRVGNLPVPAFAAEPLARLLLSRLGSDLPLSLAREMVQAVVFTPTYVSIAYRWRKGASSQVRDMLVSPEDLDRLRLAQEDLARLVTEHASRSMTLDELLVPMLASAASRSVTGDAVAEHRAVLSTLTLYVVRRRLGRWVRRANDWPQPAFRSVTLAGREDLAKHFMVSAVVSSQSGGALSDAVGQTKELDDARGGSGFSFADLAADRAGTLFGELATGDAEQLQEAVAAGLTERDFMPSIADLPEFMREGEFAERFGGIGTPRYQAMMQRIESRLAALPLYRR